MQHRNASAATEWAKQRQEKLAKAKELKETRIRESADRLQAKQNATPQKAAPLMWGSGPDSWGDGPPGAQPTPDRKPDAGPSMPKPRPVPTGPTNRVRQDSTIGGSGSLCDSDDSDTATSGPARQQFQSADPGDDDLSQIEREEAMLRERLAQLQLKKATVGRRASGGGGLHLTVAGGGSDSLDSYMSSSGGRAIPRPSSRDNYGEGFGDSSGPVVSPTGRSDSLGQHMKSRGEDWCPSPGVRPNTQPESNAAGIADTQLPVRGTRRVASGSRAPPKPEWNSSFDDVPVGGGGGGGGIGSTWDDENEPPPEMPKKPSRRAAPAAATRTPPRPEWNSDDTGSYLGAAPDADDSTANRPAPIRGGRGSGALAEQPPQAGQPPAKLALLKSKMKESPRAARTPSREANPFQSGRPSAGDSMVSSNPGQNGAFASPAPTAGRPAQQASTPGQQRPNSREGGGGGGIGGFIRAILPGGRRPPSASSSGPPASSGPPRSVEDAPIRSSGNPFGGASPFAASSLPPEADVDAPLELFECDGCGRKFNEKALNVHQRVCKKVFQEKRKVFNTTEMRVEGTEQAKFVAQSTKKAPAATPAKAAAGGKSAAEKKAEWKAQSEALREAMRQSRLVSEHLKAGKDIRDLPVVQSAPDPSMLQCPHCNRRFNQTAGERHIPKCKDIQAKPTMLKAGGGVPNSSLSKTKAVKRG
eukprot:jgi/Mesvir1/21605/Mv04033-RA.1